MTVSCWEERKEGGAVNERREGRKRNEERQTLSRRHIAYVLNWSPVNLDSECSGSSGSKSSGSGGEDGIGIGRAKVVVRRVKKRDVRRSKGFIAIWIDRGCDESR